MTRVNFLDYLKAIWTRQRIEVAVKMLRKDQTVQNFVAGVEDTNVIGNKLFGACIVSLLQQTEIFTCHNPDGF